MARRNFIHFIKNFSRKHRLSLHDRHDESEVWYMFISPQKALAMIVAVILLLFILILTLVAYTPILSLIPGYSGASQRETMIQSILRVDSIERRLVEIEEWGYDVSLIMEGRTPFMRDVTQRGDSVAVVRPEAVERNEADSILRAEMEGDGIYALNRTAATGARTTEAIFQTPVHGVVTMQFSPGDGMFGVGVATVGNREVLTLAEGTVIFSEWSPGGGYTVQVQHADNFVSINRRLSHSMVTPGMRVRRGEVIGYTGGAGDEGEEDDGGAGGGLYELELWHNGTPVNPENYIIF